MDPRSTPFREEADRGFQASQTTNFLTLLLSEMMLVPTYQMTPDPHWARPLEIAEGTTPWVLVYVCYVPPSFLVSEVFLFAAAIGAEPLLGTTFTMLDTLRTLYVWNLARICRSYDYANFVPTVLTRKGRCLVSSRCVFELLR